MNKLADMELFTLIVKHQGLASAGRELGLSPASVTSRLQALEERYGVKLLNRSTRHIALTDSGLNYYESCLQILESVREAEAKLHNTAVQIEGQIRISAPKDIGKQFVMPAIDTFQQQYPKVVPHLLLHDNLSSWSESNIDLQIRYGSPPDSGMIAKRLAVSERVLVASPAYIDNHGLPNDPEQLRSHQCLSLLRNEQEMKLWYFQHKESDETSSHQVLSFRCSDDGEVIRHWAKQGVGIALKSRLDVEADVKAGTLQILLPDFRVDFKPFSSNNDSELYAVYRDRKYQPKRLTLFLKHLIDAFATAAR
ncbi:MULTISPECIES: LysR family transcriptional regulator [Vibrio]|uniref:LysR family transcriptional regulator n=1 Tax=Vibrio TaxID=662 RepID=UPI0001B94068|nr:MULTISPECIES: LysR family transcriptional regulator [Vibrio]EEX31233.1 transcriptional regulator LysR family [Vibrio coralliilyticus ATCC BAA-450]MCM5507096.1 LysR family transcriptional regulator [Vibrio sp. SCSIO 43169]MDE3896433.1 LysR family transcriptional regulator [Vibrio sp. CC007]QFT36554.1 HTH-type transcriptional regulator DmlR [Vibrio sp. THAF64]QGM34455.1 HTH-type transcriptional regulator DmlR [Vibrio sp. THAF191d]